jgi:hypothetical protein
LAKKKENKVQRLPSARESSNRCDSAIEGIKTKQKLPKTPAEGMRYKK